MYYSNPKQFLMKKIMVLCVLLCGFAMVSHAAMPSVKPVHKPSSVLKNKSVYFSTTISGVNVEINGSCWFDGSDVLYLDGTLIVGNNWYTIGVDCGYWFDQSGPYNLPVDVTFGIMDVTDYTLANDWDFRSGVLDAIIY